MGESLTPLMPTLKALAVCAGEAIMRVYDAQTCDVMTKDDNTPLTEADIAAHDILYKGLSPLLPNTPVLSEEGVLPEYDERAHWQQYWCIDPLDGTKGFIERTGEFSINIALIRAGQPILGVVYIPQTRACYWAIHDKGAFSDIQARTTALSVVSVRHPIRLLVSRFYHGGGKLAKTFPIAEPIETIRCGSAYKFCKLAEGQADVYIRLGPTSEWDTAAGQCILHEAGGAVLNLEGNQLTYNQRTTFVNPPFIAFGDVSVAWFEKFMLSQYIP